MFMSIELIEPLTQFGAAGLMGALWIYERLLSRHREAQLNASHRQLMKQQYELQELVQLVRSNTEAIRGFERSQDELQQTLTAIRDELRRRSVA
jgi:hypothetical protein